MSFESDDPHEGHLYRNRLKWLIDFRPRKVCDYSFTYGLTFASGIFFALAEGPFILLGLSFLMFVVAKVSHARLPLQDSEQNNHDRRK